MTEDTAKEPDEGSSGTVAAYFNAIAAFRSNGSGGASARLIADRQADDNARP